MIDISQRVFEEKQAFQLSTSALLIISLSLAGSHLEYVSLTDVNYQQMFRAYEYVSPSGLINRQHVFICMCDNLKHEVLANVCVIVINSDVSW